MDQHLLAEQGVTYNSLNGNRDERTNTSSAGETNGTSFEDEAPRRSELSRDEMNPDWHLMRTLSGFSCWETPVFDFSSWFAIGIYMVLMFVIPWVRQGSNSIILCSNVCVFIGYVYWYSWFANCTKNEAVKCLSSGFYLGGLTIFMVAVVTYFYMGVPTAVYVYQPHFSTPYLPTYQVVLGCLVVAFLFTGLLQEGLKYWLVMKTGSLEYLAFDDRVATNQVVGGSVGIGIGSILGMLTLALMIFDMSWMSRVELWCLSVCWQLPLVICTSYIVGTGIADREILELNTSVFAVLCMPVFYTTLAYFQEFLIIALHPSVFVRLLAFSAIAVLNLVVLAAVGLDVWQRSSVMKKKQRLRARQIASDSMRFQ